MENMIARLLSWKALLGSRLVKTAKKRTRAGAKKRVVEKDDGRAERVEMP